MFLLRIIQHIEPILRKHKIKILQLSQQILPFLQRTILCIYLWSAFLQCENLKQKTASKKILKAGMRSGQKGQVPEKHGKS